MHPVPIVAKVSVAEHVLWSVAEQPTIDKLVESRDGTKESDE